jgi:hypothetical protein
MAEAWAGPSANSCDALVARPFYEGRERLTERMSRDVERRAGLAEFE